MNRKYDPKYDVLSHYAVAILTGQPLAELAAKEGMTIEQMNETLKEIDDVNPPLYNQLQNKLRVSGN